MSERISPDEDILTPLLTQAQKMSHHVTQMQREASTVFREAVRRHGMRVVIEALRRLSTGPPL